jgi:hypothetical protein
MTLANMRENGMRSLSVTCEARRHAAVMNAGPSGDRCLIQARRNHNK